MDKGFESKYHSLEDDNWWFKSRREIVLNLVLSLGISTKSKILEIGCSSGIFMEVLMKNGFKNVYGIDISKKAIELSKKRGLKNVFVMDGTKIKLNKKFDLVIASDVIEHIKDDEKALKEWGRLLEKDGKIIIFTPAFGYLWSPHDEINHHYRRYSESQLVSLLNKMGFDIIRNSYWNFLLFFPKLVLSIPRILKLSANKTKKDQLYALPKLINNALLLMLKFENLMLKMIDFPFGVSVFSVAKKR